MSCFELAILELLLVSCQLPVLDALICGMMPGQHSTCPMYFLSLYRCPRLSFVLYQHPPRLRAEDSSSHQEQTPPHHQETFWRLERRRHRSRLTDGGVSVYTGTINSTWTNNEWINEWKIMFWWINFLFYFFITKCQKLTGTSF